MTEEEALEKYDLFIHKCANTLKRQFYFLDGEDIDSECFLAFILSFRALDERGDELRDGGIFQLSRTAMFRRVERLARSTVRYYNGRLKIFKALPDSKWGVLHNTDPVDAISFNRFVDHCYEVAETPEQEKIIDIALSKFVTIKEIGEEVGFSLERTRRFLNKVCDGKYSENKKDRKNGHQDRDN